MSRAFTLEEAAAELHMCGKTLAAFLRKYPQDPPLYAKPGRDYLISPSDLLRIYRIMQVMWGLERMSIPALDALLAKPPREDGFIYFVQRLTGGPIKIGFAVEPERRVKALATGSSEPLVFLGQLPGNRATERKIHEQFAHLREHGEWFRPGPDLTTFVEGLQ